MNTSLNKSKNNCRKIRFFAQFVLSSMIALLSISCEDDLKEESFSSFTGDSFYNSVEAAEQGMYGIYNVLSLTRPLWTRVPTILSHRNRYRPILETKTEETTMTCCQTTK